MRNDVSGAPTRGLLRVVVGMTVAMAALTTLGASPRSAGPEEKATRPSAGAALGGQPSELAPGMRAFKDAKTGRLREAEQEELRQLAMKAGRGRGARRLRALEAGGAGLQALEGPDGAVGVALDESYMTALVATVGPDGRVRLQHVDGLSAGEARVGAGDGAAGEDRHDR